MVLMYDGILHRHFQVSFNVTAVKHRRYSFSCIHILYLAGLYISKEVLATMETQLD